MMKETWKIGNHTSEVVSDTKQRNTNFPAPPNRDENEDEEVRYYGGYLVCESIGSTEKAKLIAAAPDLLEALQSIVKYWNTPQQGSMNDHIDHSLKLAQAAIEKATV